MEVWNDISQPPNSNFSLLSPQKVQETMAHVPK